MAGRRIAITCARPKGLKNCVMVRTVVARRVDE